MEEVKEKYAIELLASGKSEREVAESIEVSQSTIHRLKEKNRDLIQKETEKLVAILPDITDQIIRDLKTSDKLSKVLAGELPISELSETLVSNVKVFTKFMDLSFKQKIELLKAIGIFPSNSPNTYIQQNYFNNSQAIVSPMVMELLSKYIKSNLSG